MAAGHPLAGQSIEHAIPFGHLMLPVHGLQGEPQLNEQVAFMHDPPAAMQASHSGVTTGIPQVMPPAPPLPPAPPVPPVLAPPPPPTSPPIPDPPVPPTPPPVPAPPS